MNQSINEGLGVIKSTKRPNSLPPGPVLNGTDALWHDKMHTLNVFWMIILKISFSMLLRSPKNFNHLWHHPDELEDDLSLSSVFWSIILYKNYRVCFLTQVWYGKVALVCLQTMKQSNCDIESMTCMSCDDHVNVSWVNILLSFSAEERQEWV